SQLSRQSTNHTPHPQRVTTPSARRTSRLGVFAVVVGAIAVSAGCYGQGGTDPSAIDLPPPEHGVQLQTPAFEVPPGTEVQHCYYFKLPSDVDLDVTRIQIKYLDGSHHMNLYQT